MAESDTTWTVRVYLPDESIMTRDGFQQLVLPGIINLLTAGDPSSQSAWRGKGWENKLQFDEEISSILRLADLNNGIVVARGQTCSEAQLLQQLLASMHVRHFPSPIRLRV